jgi:hypothetical protein
MRTLNGAHFMICPIPVVRRCDITMPLLPHGAPEAHTKISVPQAPHKKAFCVSMFRLLLCVYAQEHSVCACLMCVHVWVGGWGRGGGGWVQMRLGGWLSVCVCGRGACRYGCYVCASGHLSAAQIEIAHPAPAIPYFYLCSCLLWSSIASRCFQASMPLS